MVESALMLGAPNRTFAEQEMFKVLEFETVLANVSPPLVATDHNQLAICEY